MEHNNIIARYAEVQGITYDEAEQQVGAPTDEEILNNIQRITTEMIVEKAKVKLNREQRRRLQKKIGKKRFNEIYAEDTAETISEEIKKLDYIELIQKLRKLNERESKENGTTN